VIVKLNEKEITLGGRKILKEIIQKQMGCCGLNPFSLGRKPVSGTLYRDNGISGSVKAYTISICRRTVGFSVSTVLCTVAIALTLVFSVDTALYGVLYCTTIHSVTKHRIP
jgi:hypothetical protein